MANKSKKAVARKAAKPGTAVAVHKPQSPTAPQTFFGMLHAIATDKGVDVAKMQSVLDMRAQENAREAKREFDQSMVELQPRLPVVTKGGKIVIRDKNNPDKIIQSTSYARWEDIHRKLMPVLNEFGFSLRHHVGNSADGRITVTAILAHKSGHREETTLTLPYDTTGSKNNVQAIGSSISYGKRYTASAMTNFLVEGEDDDGQAGGGTPDPGVISPDQVRTIQDIMAKKNIPATRVLTYASTAAKVDVPTIQDIPANIGAQVISAMRGAA